MSSHQGHRAVVKDHPVPAVGNDDILIKTTSVAQNPTDWKRTSGYLYRVCSANIRVPGSHSFQMWIPAVYPAQSWAATSPDTS